MSYITPLHPGLVLQDELREIGISPSQLAAHIGVLPKTINEICNGKRGISAAMARKLSKFVGASPMSWMNLQNNWELSQADKISPNTMNKEKREKLEAKGWKVSTVSKFLNLTTEDSAEIEKKLSKDLIDAANQALQHAKGERNDLRETTLAKYKGFTARIKFSNDDNVFVGLVIDSADIIAFHGETLDETVREFHGMIDFYIEITSQRKGNTEVNPKKLK